MRRTKEDTETTRQAIMDAATKVFSRQGYAVTRLEDIAHQAGVTRVRRKLRDESNLCEELQDESQP